MNFPPGTILNAKHEESFYVYRDFNSPGFVKRINEGDKLFVLEEYIERDERDLEEDYHHYLMLDSFGAQFWIVFPAALNLEPFEILSLLPI